MSDKTNMPLLPPKAEEFGYLGLPESNLPMYKEATYSEKMSRAFRANPFVPIGVGVTIFALSFGIFQLKTGNKAMSQKMMRLRVLAQGFTIVTLLGGVAYNAYKEKKQKKTI